MQAMMASIEDAYVQHRESLLDEGTFQSVLRTSRGILAVPAWRAVWLSIRDGYSDDFRAFVEEQIAATPLRKGVDAGALLNAAIEQLALKTA